jgi:lipid-A-disaccharide synthase-like uncharacterized protein
VTGWFEAPPWWTVLGFAGQLAFGGRFLVQWLASERRGRVVVPAVFWWLSLAGGLALFAYAVQRRDPVFAVGQGLGLAVYARNLALHRRGRGAGEGDGGA